MENYKAILDSLHEFPVQDRNRDILIIDGLNTLLRAFVAVKLINVKGNNVGGISGFLKSLGALRRQFNPSRIIIAWDGKGGATNRKRINSNYKAQRVQSGVIHWDMYDDKEEEMKSIHDQGERLVDYLSCLPVTYVKIDKLEADDIIAHMALVAAKQGKHVTIVSMDKDFMQLISQNIDVYSPTKKTLYTYEKAVDFLGVLPENYNIVKALVGDSSDNLDGIKGCGIKTLIKLFPKLTTDPTYSMQGLYDTCAANLGRKKLYATIIANWQKVEDNFKIMDLHETMLDDFEKKFLYTELKRPTPKLRIGHFMSLMEQDYIPNLTNDDESWLIDFSNLS